MLSIIAIESIHALPGYSGSKRIPINQPMGAVMVDEGVLLLDGGRHPAGGRHMLVPWSNIRCVELDAEAEEDDKDGYGASES